MIPELQCRTTNRAIETWLRQALLFRLALTDQLVDRIASELPVALDIMRPACDLIVVDHV